MGRFPKLLTGLFREFRNSYNEGVEKVDIELDLQKKRVDDLILANPSPNEVQDARGGFTILRDRLNNSDIKLAEKASKEEIANIGNATPKGVYATHADLQTAFPTGTIGIYLVTADGKWYYWNGFTWTAGGTYQGTGIPDGTITKEKVKLNGGIVTLKSGVNRIDLSKASIGYYVAYNDGKLYANANYYASDYIPVSETEQVTLSTWDNTDLRQFAWYSSNNENSYISGEANTGIRPSKTYTPPAGAKFVRLTIHVNSINFTQFQKGLVATPFQKYNEFVDPSYTGVSKTNKLIKTITVKQDGTGNYTSLRRALEYATAYATVTSPILVEVYPGTYNVMADYTSAEIANVSFRGPMVNDNVEVVGIGDRNKIILKGSLDPATYTVDVRRLVSTINMNGNCKLKNLTVESTAIRYAVHDDQGDNVERYFENVVMIQRNADYGGGCALGGGTHTGSKHIFKDCKFVQEMTTTNDAWSYHNNLNFTDPSYIECENCEFISVNGISNPKLYSLGSGVKDIAVFKNCRINGKIDNRELSGYAGVGLDFIIKGYGLKDVPVQQNTNLITQPNTNQTDATTSSFNGSGSAITKGTPVYMNSGRNTIMPFGTTTSTLLFYGVAIEDIANGTNGVVQTGGYLQLKDTPLTGVVIGNKIGVVNGTLAVVTGSDYIGVVSDSLFIKLIV